MEILIGFFLTVVFFIVLIVIATEKIDKVSITLAGVVITLFIALIGRMINNFDVLYKWIDLELIMTIIGISLIMEALKKSGVLEVFILYILRSIQGSFYILTLILSSSVFILSMMITNVLALIIVSSITVLIGEVSEFNPKPLLFLELVISNLAGMLTPIASYTAAYVSLEQAWSYLDFLVISLPYVLIMFIVTLIVTYLFYKDKIHEMIEKQKDFGTNLNRLLKTIDPWSFVDSQRNFYKACIIFIFITLFLGIGTTIGVTVDLICLFGGMVVLIFFSDNVNEFIHSIDWPMIYFLVGIFIMSGLIQQTEIPLLLNNPIIFLMNISPSIGIVAFTWILGLFTSIIENIPLIFLLRPLIDTISLTSNPRVIWWAILAVVNITDSMLLISSVKGIYILEMTSKEGMKIGFFEYAKYGFIITLIHLVGMAMYVFLLLLF